MAGNKTVWIIALGLVGFGVALGAEGTVVLENVTRKPDSYRFVPAGNGYVVPVPADDDTRPWHFDVEPAPTAVSGKESEGRVLVETPVSPTATPESEHHIYTNKDFAEIFRALSESQK